MSEQPNTNLSDIVADAVWSAFDTFGIDDNDRLVDLLCQKFQDVLASDPRFPRLTNLEFDLLVADLRRDAQRIADQAERIERKHTVRAIVEDVLSELQPGQEQTS
ncbi:MAG: hypothetical protein ACLQJR_19110 [Stellaceae bacterium]